MTAPVCVVGGWGVVGSRIARVLRARHPALPLVLAGRRPEQGADLARELDATTAALDVRAADPLAALPVTPGAVVAAVNDPDDRLLLAAARTGVPLVDITRWTSRVHAALVRLAAAPPRGPVLLASSWMAGVAPLLARAVAAALPAVDEIQIGILYDTADHAGADSMEYVDRLTVPFEVLEDGRPVVVVPASDGRPFRFSGDRARTAYRIDTPEQATLPAFTGARTVATRIAWEPPSAGRALAVMRRTGVLALLAHERFTGVRRALMASSGTGGAAEIVVEARGDGRVARGAVHDPAGQAHLTAVGAVVGVERLLGLDGASAPAPGVRFPEQTPALAAALGTLGSCGVAVDLPTRVERDGAAT